MPRNTKSKHTFRAEADTKQLKGKMKDIRQDFKKTGESGFKAFKFKIAAGIGAAVAGFATLLNKAADWIKAASELQETTSKFETVFKDVALEAEIANKALQDEFGLSELQARKLLSATGDLLTGFNFTGKEALDLSNQVNRLAVDLASFTNAQGGAEAVSAALTKALLGERESLKTYGIAIRDADIQARLAEEGLDKLTGAARRQAEALVTLKLATEQSKNAIGDYARTSDSFANTARRFDAAIENINASLGKLLLPTVTDIIEETTKWVDLINDYIKIPLSDNIIQEKDNLNDLVTSIANAGEKTKIRKDLIGELQKQYPDFLGNLDKEKVTNQQLFEQLQKVNEQYEKKIRLQIAEEDYEKQLRKVVELERERVELESGIDKNINSLLRQRKVDFEITDSRKERLRLLTEELEKIDQTASGRDSQANEFRKTYNEVINAQRTSLNLDIQLLGLKKQLADAEKALKAIRSQTPNTSSSGNEEERAARLNFALNELVKKYTELNELSIRLNNDSLIPSTEDVEGYTDDIKTFADEINTTQIAAMALAESLGQAFSPEAYKDGLRGILNVLLDFLGNFITGYLTAAIARGAIGDFTGFVSIAAAQALFQTLKGNVKSFATGGMTKEDGVYNVHRGERLFLPEGTEVQNERSVKQAEDKLEQMYQRMIDAINYQTKVIQSQKFEIRGDTLRRIERKSLQNRL